MVLSHVTISIVTLIIHPAGNNGGGGKFQEEKTHKIYYTFIQNQTNECKLLPRVTPSVKIHSLGVTI